MTFREAVITDIPEIQIVRHTVKENVLSNPDLVTNKDCEDYLFVRGKGWVCITDNQLVGFAIVDLQDHNVWALFLRPEYEGKGIGKQLQNMMLEWYFEQTKETLWLGTAFHTRAENFYRMQGWKEAGMHGTKEIKFEMRYDDWKAIRNPKRNET